MNPHLPPRFSPRSRDRVLLAVAVVVVVAGIAYFGWTAGGDSPKPEVPAQVSVAATPTPAPAVADAAGGLAPGDPQAAMAALPGVSVGADASSTAGSAEGTAPPAWTRDATDATPSHYYTWDHPWSAQQASRESSRDADGVLLSHYPGLAGAVYSPVAICQDAIGDYEMWLHRGQAPASGDPVSAAIAAGSLERFLAEARWLRDTGMDSRGRLPYRFTIGTTPGSPRLLKAPWYSAMAQGLAISVLTRAYVQTGDKTFLSAAKAAFQPYTHDVAEPPATRGVSSGGGRWLEEYPDATHVLNGSMFAMFGAWDLWRVTRGRDVRAVFDRAERNLAHNLTRYESHGAILYELTPDRFSYPNYFNLQNIQLDVLAALSGDKALKKTADRWRSDLRAYPAPEFVMPAPIVVKRGTVAQVVCQIDYFYRYYYPRVTSVAISYRPLGSTGPLADGGTARIIYNDSTHARFTFTSMPMDRARHFEFRISGQPSLAPTIQHEQFAWATWDVNIDSPTVTDAVALGDPASPNGDGFGEAVTIRYALESREAVVTLNVLDASGGHVATIPGRSVAGRAAAQAPGVYWARYAPRTADGRALPDGAYQYTIQAASPVGSAGTSGWFFVDSGLRQAPPLGTRPVLTGVGVVPAVVASGGSARFGFTTSADAYVTIKVFGAGGPVRTVADNVLRKAGRGGVPWNGRADGGSTLAPGSYRYYVYASGGGPKPATSLAGGIVTVR